MQEHQGAKVLALKPPGVIREFKTAERFHVGESFEIFRCDDTTGSFLQVAGPFMDKSTAEAALGAFQNHPDFKGAGTKLFIAECSRVAIVGTFNPKLITVRA